MCHRVCVERAGFEPNGGGLDQIPEGVKAPKQECCSRKLVRSEHDLAYSRSRKLGELTVSPPSSM